MEADPFPPAAEVVDRANRVQALLVVDVDPDEQVVVVPAVAAAVGALAASAMASSRNADEAISPDIAPSARTTVSSESNNGSLSS